MTDEGRHKPEMLWKVLRESGGYRRDVECFLNAQFVPDILYHQIRSDQSLSHVRLFATP